LCGIGHCEAITFRRTLVGNFHGLLAYSEMIHRLQYDVTLEQAYKFPPKRFNIGDSDQGSDIS
jgi:hypothetical protein